MNFAINEKKATQAVGRLIEKSHGPIDYLRLVKLIYLADRESIRTRHVPIVGGKYYSMRRGPVIGEIMAFVGNRSAEGWKHTISPRFGNEVRLKLMPQTGALSLAEIKILDAVVEQHLSRTTEELVAWCHKNCPEYEEVTGSARKPIAVESILKSSGKSDAKIKAIIDEAQSIEELENLLS